MPFLSLLSPPCPPRWSCHSCTHTRVSVPFLFHFFVISRASSTTSVGVIIIFCLFFPSLFLPSSYLRLHTASTSRPLSSHTSTPISFLPGGCAGSSSVGQLRQDPDAEYHDEQADGDDDEQGEAEPAEDHGAGADAGHDAAVAEVLRDDGRGHRGRVLPQHRHEHEHRRHEDDRQRHLRHRPARERLDLPLRPLAVLLLVPAGEGRQQQEADEGEDDGDDAVRRGEDGLSATSSLFFCFRFLLLLLPLLRPRSKIDQIAKRRRRERSYA